MTETYFNRAEAEEREYLKHIQGKIGSQLSAVNAKGQARHAEMLDLQTYLQENKTEKQERHQIRKEIRAFSDSGCHSLGIICKTQEQAKRLYQKLRREAAPIRLLDARSTTFSKGVVIATACLAKGLEFDQVVVPFCGDADYSTPIDRQMLYVACTRAMHKLTLSHRGESSRFLESALERSAAQPVAFRDNAATHDRRYGKPTT